MSSLFNRWVLLALLLFGSVVGFFWFDVSESAADGVKSVLVSGASPVPPTEQEVAKAKGFFFQSEQSPSVEVDDFKEISRSDNRTIVSFRLAKREPGRLEPTLVLTLSSNEGQVLRTFAFAPEIYRRSVSAIDGTLHLNFATAPNETRIRVVETDIDLKPLP